MIDTREKEVIIGVVILIIIVAAVGLVLGGYFDGKVGDGVNKPININPETGTFRDLEAGEVQTNFPEDFPFEEGAGITNNYKYDLIDSLNDQYTIEYESKRSVEENFTLFEEYLISHYYSISNSMNKGDMAFLYGDKADGDMSILIEEKNGTVIINTSFLKQ